MHLVFFCGILSKNYAIGFWTVQSVTEARSTGYIFLIFIAVCLPNFLEPSFLPSNDEKYSDNSFASTQFHIWSTDFY